MSSRRFVVSAGTVAAFAFVVFEGCGGSTNTVPNAAGGGDAGDVDGGAMTTPTEPTEPTDGGGGTLPVDDAGDAGDGGDVDAGGCTPAHTIQVTVNPQGTAYKFSTVGGNNPAITIPANTTTCFDVNAPGHPFWIKTVQGTGTANGVPGVVNNGTAVGRVIWTPPVTAAPYYYDCEIHAAMTGTITVN